MFWLNRLNLHNRLDGQFRLDWLTIGSIGTIGSNNPFIELKLYIAFKLSFSNLAYVSDGGCLRHYFKFNFFFIFRNKQTNIKEQK
jgi:hypothetical protein